MSENNKPLSAEEISDLVELHRKSAQDTVEYGHDFSQKAFDLLPRLLSMLQPTTDIPGAVDEAKAWMDASWASRLYPSAVRDCWETLVRAHTDLERELKMAASNRQEWMVACLEKQSELAALKPGPTDAAVREAVQILRVATDFDEVTAPAVETLLSYVRAAQSDSSARGEADAMLAAMYGECTMCGEGPGCEKDCDGYIYWTPKHDTSPESVELLKRLRLADLGKLSAALRAAQSPRLTEEQVEALRKADMLLDSDCISAAFPGVFGKE